jgi:hypothetical protein
MASPAPRVRSVSDIKSRLLNPALTSHYECFFNPPDQVRRWIKNRIGAGVGVKEYDYDQISISCCDASLPGSQIATYELNDDFTGVTERNAYRRQYDDRADFTFYVDHDYTIISFFENWMAYIANEQINTASTGGAETRPEEDPTKYGYYYRMNYPEDYKADAIYIHKFERDLGKQSTLNKRYLQYRFIRAFPVSINSMPVSYESSSLLKCTVSFAYIRYIVNNLYYPNPKTNNPTTTTNNVPGNNFGVDPSIPTPTQFVGDLGPLSARGGRVVDM